MHIAGTTFVEDCAGTLTSAPHETGTRSLLLGGAHALWADGDRLAGRDWFDAAYRIAESEDDVEAMAWSALGLSGLWLHEHRNTATAVLVETRLRRALAGVLPQSSLALRLKARLAGEADYRAGEHAAILAVVQEARHARDPIAWAEAANMAHHCLLGPDHGPLRHALAQELIAGSFQTARRSDLLLGLLWRTVDLFLDADPHAERQLADLNGLLAQDNHLAVRFVTHAIEVMLSIRAGRFEQAEQLAKACIEHGAAAGDADATGWHGTHMLAIHWYQGRVAEFLPMLHDLVNSPTLSAVDDSHLAAIAVAAATAGDHRQAAGALARLRGRDLTRLPRSGSWMVTMYSVAEAANLLDDGATSAAVYDMLHPFAHLPIMAGPGVACFGSVQHTLGVTALTTGNLDQAVMHLRAAVHDNLTIGHWPAAALSRARLAQALASRANRGDSALAERELTIAMRDAAALHMTLPAYQHRPAVSETGHSGQQPVVCQRRAGRWVIEQGHHVALVDESLGMEYLAVLIANPGSAIPAVQLAAGPGLLSLAAADSAASRNQPVLDEAAQRAYRQRLSQLQADVEAHRSRNDTVRAARAQAELDWLVTELKAASGLGGRSRSFANSDERARISVGRAIRRALNRIEAANPAIGRQLRETVTTGLRCCYRPTSMR